MLSKKEINKKVKMTVTAMISVFPPVWSSRGIKIPESGAEKAAVIPVANEIEVSVRLWLSNQLEVSGRVLRVK